jgi:protein-S-isoprenylcysteine O-methyltransferase Ste14
MRPDGKPNVIMLAMLRIAAYVVLTICWVAWSLSFVKPHRSAAGHKKAVRAPSSRWGIFFVFLGFMEVWAYVQPAGFEKPAASLIASMIVGPPSVALAWAATRHLDKHWRFEAALSEDHELIRTGPYRWLRHPIYASMLGMLVATGLVKAWWPLFVAGAVFFLIGTEIRVRAEDGLLGARFGEEFARYKQTTRAYLPFLR